MTATNHALTGAIIGLSVHQPVAAMVLAIGSHFVLDAIPHFALRKDKHGSRGFRYYLIAEVLLCVALVAFLLMIRPQYWLLAALCAFLAASPDFMWAPGFFKAQNGREYRKPTYALARFHSAIQWFQRPIGAVVELAWFICAMGLFVTIT